MSMIRVQRTAAATLTRTVFVDETATDEVGSVSVAVTRLDGTAVVSGTATHTGVGVYTYTLPGTATAQLDHLDVTWVGALGGSTVSLVDRVEVVGGFLFGLAEARASDPSLSNVSKYPTSALVQRRMEVEQECQRITGRSFVPQFRRVVLPAPLRPTMVLPDVDIRGLRYAATVSNPGPVTAVLSTATDVSASPGGVLTWFGGADNYPRGFWPASSLSMIVEYEYGRDFPPEDLRQAAMVRLRTRLNAPRSGVPDRVASYTTPDGASYRLTMPSRGSTGVPEVDAVYADYEAPTRGFA